MNAGERKQEITQNSFLLFLTGEPTAPLRWRSQLPLCVLVGEEHLATRSIPLRQVLIKKPGHEALNAQVVVRTYKKKNVVYAAVFWSRIARLHCVSQ